MLETLIPNCFFEEIHAIQQFKKKQPSNHQERQDVWETECRDGINMVTWVLYQVFCNPEVYLFGR